MAPQKRAKCQVCSENESKYTCAQCDIVYCSLGCYKNHKASACKPRQDKSGGPSTSSINAQPLESSEARSAPEVAPEVDPAEEPPLTEPLPLRPLTSLRWPYIPDESAYPDPLKRDDPKALQMHQYEAIATSPAVRRALVAHPQLKDALRTLDALRGPDREEALQRALGVGEGRGAPGTANEEVRAMRVLAEAVEGAVRGGREGALGLDWGEGA